MTLWSWLMVLSNHWDIQLNQLLYRALRNAPSLPASRKTQSKGAVLRSHSSGGRLDLINLPLPWLLEVTRCHCGTLATVSNVWPESDHFRPLPWTGCCLLKRPVLACKSAKWSCGLSFSLGSHFRSLVHIHQPSQHVHPTLGSWFTMTLASHSRYMTENSVPFPETHIREKVVFLQKKWIWWAPFPMHPSRGSHAHVPEIKCPSKNISPVTLR